MSSRRRLSLALPRVVLDELEIQGRASDLLDTERVPVRINELDFGRAASGRCSLANRR